MYVGAHTGSAEAAVVMCCHASFKIGILLPDPCLTSLLIMSIQMKIQFLFFYLLSTLCQRVANNKTKCHYVNRCMQSQR